MLMSLTSALFPNSLKPREHYVRMEKILKVFEQARINILLLDAIQ